MLNKKLTIFLLCLFFASTAFCQSGKDKATAITGIDRAIIVAAMPQDIKDKIAAIKAGVESKVEAKSAKTNKARVKDGDWILLHDGSAVKAFRQIDPLEEMSFPNTLTCFIGTKEKCEKEIEKLNK